MMLTPDSCSCGQESSSTPEGDVSVLVNGETLRIPALSRVTDLLDMLGLAGRPLAVEINREVVPRRQLAERTLAEGDQLEIVTLVGGG